MKIENLLINCENGEIIEYNRLKKNSEILNQKELFGESYISDFPALLNDIYFAFYLENPKIKEIENISPRLWLNYFILEGITEHYKFKNINSYSSKHPLDAFWITETFANELLNTFMNKKKIINFITSSIQFLKGLESIGMDYAKINNKPAPDISKEEVLKWKKIKEKYMEIKKEIKMLTIKSVIEVNKIINILQPLINITRGNDICPLSIAQISYEKRIPLVEKLMNQKMKEIINDYINSDISGKYNLKKHQDKSWEETISESSPQEVFYLNNNEHDEKGTQDYKKWIKHELEQYNPEEKYGLLTLYIKAGNLESKSDELGLLSVAFEIMEIARLEKRNVLAIISNIQKGEKTFMFTPSDVTVYDNNKTIRNTYIEGMIDFIADILSGPIPPKQKMSLNLKLNLNLKSSKSPSPTVRKKLFKKPPILIKLN